MEDLLAALGSGELSDAALSNRLTQLRADEVDQAGWMPKTKGPVPLDSPIVGHNGAGGGRPADSHRRLLLAHSGDAIIGFVTRSRASASTKPGA